MSRSKLFLLAVMIGIVACQTATKESNDGEKADSVKIAESIRTNRSYLNDLGAIEQVFGNENWLLVDKKDSSYYYFSRLGEFKFNTYAYKIVKGDSANVLHSSFKPENNAITWDFGGRKLVINSATRARVVGTVIGSDSLTYEFVRLDDDEIAITYPDKKKLVMHRTLPLGLFLVRSRYDYTHATKYAFDTIQFRKKK